MLTTCRREPRPGSRWPAVLLPRPVAPCPAGPGQERWRPARWSWDWPRPAPGCPSRPRPPPGCGPSCPSGRPCAGSHRQPGAGAGDLQDNSQVLPCHSSSSQRQPSPAFASQLTSVTGHASPSSPSSTTSTTSTPPYYYSSSWRDQV